MYRTKLRAGWGGTGEEAQDYKYRERTFCSNLLEIYSTWGRRQRRQLTWRAIKTVLALMANVITATRGHMTRSEWRISLYKEAARGFLLVSTGRECSVNITRTCLLVTTELCSFSGRGSLISTGGSSGVRFSNSGNNLERTSDLQGQTVKGESIPSARS